MTVPELRQAITEPAAAEGLSLEPGLVEVLLRDLGTAPGTGRCASGRCRCSPTPCAPPGSTATTAACSPSPATSAPAGSTGRSPPPPDASTRAHPGRQRAVRPVLLRMVRVGDDEDHVRQPADRAELIEIDPHAEAVVEAFTAARLLTAGTSGVEISHEALLRPGRICGRGSARTVPPCGPGSSSGRPPRCGGRKPETLTCSTRGAACRGPGPGRTPRPGPA